MSEFKQYLRKQIAELRPWEPGEDMRGVSVSVADIEAGSPRPGDMIARNPKNHDEVKSKQNWKAEWEEAAFRARVEVKR